MRQEVIRDRKKADELIMLPRFTGATSSAAKLLSRIRDRKEAEQLNIEDDDFIFTARDSPNMVDGTKDKSRKVLTSQGMRNSISH